MRRSSQGRLRRRVPESPAQDAAQTRLEDNFGIPLDALYLSPPVGSRSGGASNASEAAQRNRDEVRTKIVAVSGKWRMRIPGAEVPNVWAWFGELKPRRSGSIRRSLGAAAERIRRDAKRSPRLELGGACGASKAKPHGHSVLSATLRPERRGCGRQGGKAAPKPSGRMVALYARKRVCGVSDGSAAASRTPQSRPRPMTPRRMPVSGRCGHSR